MGYSGIEGYEIPTLNLRFEWLILTHYYTKIDVPSYFYFQV